MLNCKDDRLAADVIEFPVPLSKLIDQRPAPLHRHVVGQVPLQLWAASWDGRFDDNFTPARRVHRCRFHEQVAVKSLAYEVWSMKRAVENHSLFSQQCEQVEFGKAGVECSGLKLLHKIAIHVLEEMHHFLN